MSRTWIARPVLSLSLALLGVATGLADAQLLPSTMPPPSIAAPSVPAPKRPGAMLAEALAANPITAPYRLAVHEQGSKIVLAGRVGDSRVHDVAVRTAIATWVFRSPTSSSTSTRSPGTGRLPGRRPLERAPIVDPELIHLSARSLRPV